LLSDSEAQDVCQEVFIALYEYKGRFENESHMIHWLIRVTKNKCYRIYERRKIENLFLKKQKEQIIIPHMRSELYYAIRSLDIKERILVYLYYYEGYTIREISKTLFINESTIASRMMKIRSKLKDILSDFSF